jgi:DNA-binding CsgD family transcriptional regulator
MTGSVPRAARELVALSRRGTVPAGLRTAVLAPLQRLLGVGPVFVASADPLTWMFTGAASIDVPTDATPLFLHNEFAEDDVVKFRHLAAADTPVGALFRQTGGRPAASARWRNVLEPLGWGDEMRVALRDGGKTWGFLCFHRERGDQPFGVVEANLLAPVMPHLAAAFRRTSLAAASATAAVSPHGPGVVLLDEEGNLVGTTGSAATWLEELGPASGNGLPLPLLGLAARLRSTGETPVLRLRGARGGWVAMHGGLLDGPGPARVAVVLEAATPALALPMLSQAVGLTPREAEVVAAVLRGESTRAIAAGLHIAQYTVQTHLTSIFAKTGVNSRRELVGQFLSGP